MILYIKYIFIVFLFSIVNITPFKPTGKPALFYTEVNRLTSSDCERLDSIPILNFSSQQFSENEDFNFIYGNRREDLTEKVTVNGSDDLEKTVFQILHDNLGYEVMQNAAYQNLEINFLLSKKGKVDYIYLTNELFWYFEEPGFGKQVNKLNFEDPEEMEMARNLFDFMTLEEIQFIKELVAGQIWKNGKCNGKRVDTIIVLKMKSDEIHPPSERGEQ